MSEGASAWLDAALVVGGLCCVALFSVALTQLCSKARIHSLRGPLLVIAVAIIWTCSNVVIQVIYDEQRYRKPVFITCVSFSAQAIYLFFYPKRFHALLLDTLPTWCWDPCSAAAPYQLADGSQAAFTVLDDEPLRITRGRAPSAVSSERLLQIAFRLGVLIIVATGLFNASLEISSVSLATLIASSSSLWTLLFSALLLREPCNCSRFACVIISMVGVAILVSSNHGRDAPQHVSRHERWHPQLMGAELVGNVFMLLSAILYGLYTVIIKRDVPNEKEIPVPFLYGLIGLLCLCGSVPLLAIFHFTHIETFAVPSAEASFVMLVNALVGTVLSNMLLARATLITNPLTVMVGLSLAIPLAMLSDVVRGGVHASHTMLFGALCIWIGFIGVAGAERCCGRLCRGLGLTAY